MSTSSRSKEIKVQRDAQSLEHFKTNVAGSEDVYVSLLKPVLIGVGALVLAVLAWLGWSNMRAKAVERHEVALAKDLQARFRAVLTGQLEPEGAHLGKLISLAGVRRYPSRIKCALLGWHALIHALGDQADAADPAQGAGAVAP